MLICVGDCHNVYCMAGAVCLISDVFKPISWNVRTLDLTCRGRVLYSTLHLFSVHRCIITSIRSVDRLRNTHLYCRSTCIDTYYIDHIDWSVMIDANIICVHDSHTKLLFN